MKTAASPKDEKVIDGLPANQPLENYALWHFSCSSGYS
jgi:hypothetical protein